MTTYSLVVPTSTDVATLDAVHEYCMEFFTETMRCKPSQAAVQPLCPERWQLDRLADRFHFMLAMESTDIRGYCVVDPESDNPGLIHWLVVADPVTVGDVMLFFCQQAFSAWALLVHGDVENEIIREALLANDTIITSGTEIVYAP